jgi:hypothetical protein
MPHWSNEPPPAPRGYGLTIRRVPPGKVFVCCIISSDLLGTRTHYWHGRTTPCETPNCPACNEGMPWRWHAYMAATEGAGHEPFLLELTAKASMPLINYRSTYGTLRGCKLKAMRANYAKNSRLIIETCPADLTKLTLPQEPNLKQVLALLWNLPESALVPTGQAGLADAIETLSDVVDHSRSSDILKLNAELQAKRAAAGIPDANGRR